MNALFPRWQWWHFFGELPPGDTCALRLISRGAVCVLMSALYVQCDRGGDGLSNAVSNFHCIAVTEGV